ncbi:MAG: substrate-binding domain-containing protein [Burkholderiales bacterium]|nr:substrate-binding domain-containing protein [Burkholderiales bacterium]
MRHIFGIARIAARTGSGVRRTRRVSIAGRAGVVALALALGVAPRPVVAQTPLDALIAAAKKEGEFVLYSSESDKQMADTNKAFEAKYGIKVRGTRLVGGAVTSRYAGERQGGTVVADAIVVANEPFITDNPTWWSPVSEATIPGYDRYPAAAKAPLYLTMNHNVIGLSWNTNLVKPADEPTNYLDLVNNPAYASKGSIVYADPRATPSAMNLFKILVERYGEDFFKKLMDRGVAIAASSSPGVQQVAAGANKVMIGNFPNNAQSVIAAGGPVKYRPVLDPATGVDNVLALSSGSKNPNAARLYAAWRISEEGQRVMCLARGSTSPLGDLPGCEPAAPPNYIKTDYRVYSDKAWQARYLPWLGLKPL